MLLLLLLLALLHGASSGAYGQARGGTGSLMHNISVYLEHTPTSILVCPGVPFVPPRLAGVGGGLRMSVGHGRMLPKQFKKNRMAPASFLLFLAVLRYLEPQCTKK